MYKRQLLGLRGNLGIQQHLNTIVDYSLLWVLGVEHQYQMTGDMDFIRQILDVYKRQPMEWYR